MEVAQVRGSVARDLHGAFAEWEAQAHTLTRCTNYLYSLSINPDQRQGRLTREQYLEYIDRTEQRLGLSGQPRAVVFHVKKDRQGTPREHCHVVWSRIDVERGKARHVAFDHEKLMIVTREFARDHGLKLPDGYGRLRQRERQINKPIISAGFPPCDQQLYAISIRKAER
ncbi:MAG: relaxase/mobilization nuclease domain-containing protein [Xanthobacteraceae bacterium]